MLIESLTLPQGLQDIGEVSIRPEDDFVTRLTPGSYLRKVFGFGGGRWVEGYWDRVTTLELSIERLFEGQITFPE